MWPAKKIYVSRGLWTQKFAQLWLCAYNLHCSHYTHVQRLHPSPPTYCGHCGYEL